MKQRDVRVEPAAEQDLFEIWQLVARDGGAERANRLLERVEGFLESLSEFAERGTKHEALGSDVRSTGIPGSNISVLFLVTDTTVIIVRIGYLGRNIWRLLE